MPKNRYSDLSNDADHIRNKDSSKKMPSSTYDSKKDSRAKPQDLGTGGARKAAEAIRARKRMLDEI